MDLIKKAKETISKYSMLTEGDHLLIGLSGGPDSVCLSVVLDLLRSEFNLSLSAVYIDHGLRPEEVKKEIEFCRKFCEEKNINFITKKAELDKLRENKKLNLQEAARIARYKNYDELSEKIGASKIALGHNADDQAETVLMRLIRGSGRRGMGGIPPVRGKIVRPLIDIKRDEIEEFLNVEPSQPYMTDSSNLDLKYHRNWLRTGVIEEIRKKNPSMATDISRTAEILREEDEYLEIIVTKTLMRLISRKSDKSIELFLIPLETIERPLLRRVLRRAVDAVEGLRGIGLTNIDDVIGLIKSGKSGDSLNLPHKIRAVREYSLLKITSEEPVVIGEYEIQPPAELDMVETGMVIKADYVEDAENVDEKASVVLDAGLMSYPLKVRHRRPGDFFFPAGFGKRKKLQDYFVDEKVPREKRDRVPIVLSGNDIIWVAGFRADERFKVSDKTEKFLRLEIFEKKQANEG